MGIYTARRGVSIPIKLGQEITRIRARALNANIPLLISNDVLKYWKAVLDFDKSVLHIHKRYQVQLQVDESGHFLIEHTDDLQLINNNTKDSYYTSSDTGRYNTIN